MKQRKLHISISRQFGYQKNSTRRFLSPWFSLALKIEGLEHAGSSISALSEADLKK